LALGAGTGNEEDKKPSKRFSNFLPNCQNYHPVFFGAMAWMCPSCLAHPDGPS